MKNLILICAAAVLVAAAGCTGKSYKRITFTPPMQAGEQSQPLEKVSARAWGLAAKSEATNLEAQMSKATDTNGVVQESRILKAGKIIGQADPESIKAGGTAIADAAQAIGDAALKIKAPPAGAKLALPGTPPAGDVENPSTSEAREEPAPEPEPET